MEEHWPDAFGGGRTEATGRGYSAHGKFELENVHGFRPIVSEVIIHDLNMIAEWSLDLPT